MAVLGEAVAFMYSATAGPDNAKTTFTTTATITFTVADGSPTDTTVGITSTQSGPQDAFAPTATVIIPLSKLSVSSANMVVQSVEVRAPGDPTDSTAVTSQASTTNLSDGAVTPATTTTGLSTSLPSTTSSAGATVVEASSTSSPVVASKAHDGVQAGAVAGIAIGCVAAGALIAFLLAFLFFRKRRRGSGSRGSDSQQSYYDDNASKAPLVAAIPVQQSRTHSALDNLLPVPVEGRQIGDQFGALGAEIAKHVGSFYANGEVTAASYTNSLTPLLGSRSPQSQDQLQDMLSRPGERTGAIRFLMAWCILRNIEPDAPPETTLLPPDLAESMAYMSADRSDRTAPDHALLLAKWRQLSGELLKSKYGDGGIVRNDTREQNIGELASMLNTALEPYATDRSDAGRLQALRELIKSGARVGYMLFTQPTSWRFAWDQVSGNSKSEMVVFPRLVQVRDEQGMLHQREQFYGMEHTVPLNR